MATMVGEANAGCIVKVLRPNEDPLTDEQHAEQAIRSILASSCWHDGNEAGKTAVRVAVYTLCGLVDALKEPEEWGAEPPEDTEVPPDELA